MALVAIEGFDHMDLPDELEQKGWELHRAAGPPTLEIDMGAGVIQQGAFYMASANGASPSNNVSYLRKLLPPSPTGLAYSTLYCSFDWAWLAVDADSFITGPDGNAPFFAVYAGTLGAMTVVVQAQFTPDARIRFAHADGTLIAETPADVPFQPSQFEEWFTGPQHKLNLVVKVNADHPALGTFQATLWEGSTGQRTEVNKHVDLGSRGLIAVGSHARPDRWGANVAWATMWDNLYCTDADRSGLVGFAGGPDTAIETTYASEDGDRAEWTPDSGTDHAFRVQEPGSIINPYGVSAFPDDDATYVRIGTEGAVDLYQLKPFELIRPPVLVDSHGVPLPPEQQPILPIPGIQLSAWARREDGDPAQIAMEVLDSASNLTDGLPLDLDGSYGFPHEIWQNAPNGKPWALREWIVGGVRVGAVLVTDDGPPPPPRAQFGIGAA